ncbi:F-box/FBD/LRR-repeat protein At1g13570-like [Rutidosis leptorrhynchoides]|uniref:F-box/FBD/LRR-repeat protein At1g13570-like n=1 Tax=Rutidosis leptorrhynchoides TaxID=125765 RepID=UPI003A99547C
MLLFEYRDDIFERWVRSLTFRGPITVIYILSVEAHVSVNMSIFSAIFVCRGYSVPVIKAADALKAVRKDNIAVAVRWGIDPIVKLVDSRIFLPINYFNMKASKRKSGLGRKRRHLSLDRISTLPAHIIDSILCLLPLKDAVRTSILSKEWRYIWTKIPVLHFSRFELNGSGGTDMLSIMGQFDFYDAQNMIRDFKILNTIKQCLLLHQGPLLEVSLIVSVSADENCVELDQIISHLSRRTTIKNFSLEIFYEDEYSMYRLPSSIFSMHQLRELSLGYCCIYHPLTFIGFGSLTSLYLDDVKISTKTLLHLVSSCPLLKSFTLLRLGKYDIVSSIIDLIECFPVIEHLIIDVSVSNCFSIDSLPKELPISLVHLKYLRIEDMLDRNTERELALLFLLIRCSPNLEELSLHISGSTSEDVLPTTFEKYSNIWLMNLKELDIFEVSDRDLHLEFAQLMLAKSPKLKKLSIGLLGVKTDDEVSNVSRILLQYPHASQSVEIIVEPC